ncbi:Ig-like domain-containing protein, partial [Enterobacter hormaechei]|nr:Ig-like domain-containing protein [Enterobacter hormaechei]
IAGNDYTATADLNGNWAIVVTDRLPDGVHDYTITATGLNGATGILQGGVIIDTQSQEITVALDSVSDTG